jgi:hypothetical protein
MPVARFASSKVAAELALHHAVDAARLLLLAQLHAVVRRLAPEGLLLAMHPRREGAALHRALGAEAALPFEEQLHAFAPAQLAN